jgi:hypothetical protein
LIGAVSRPNHHTFYHAPTVIIVSGDQSSPYFQYDCAAAAENILIAAESLNIGSCWIGTFLPLFVSEKGEEYKNVLGIPEGYNPICSVALGYKAVEHAAVTSRNKDTINSIVPGVFKSELGREGSWLLRKIMYLIAISAEEAAEKIVHLTTSNEVGQIREKSLLKKKRSRS